ncbi:MAG: efflux RND transporter periplasmic adaptor subunit [Epsilonproteobacteria bacterium]|nr:efflux RND transporter periplasmic adaptor subunit [Campylobacterota bacterium]
MKKILALALSVGALFAFEYATAKKETINITRDYVANVYSPKQVMVATRLMGYIKSMPVEEGDVVKKGQLLFEVDPADIYSMLNQARGAVLQAKSGVLMAEMAYADALKDYERFKNLYKNGAVSKRDFEKMTLMKNIRKKQVDMAKGMLKQAEAGLARAEAQLKYAKVTSPIDGVVTMKMKKVAEMALPGYPVVVLSDIHVLKAKSTVKESDIDKFKIGMPVNIYVPALKKSFPAKVSTIIPAGDNMTHSFVIKYTFENHQGLLPGMYAKAKIVVGKKEAVVVPFSALTTRAGIVGVFVNDNGVARFVPVKQVGQVGDNIAVTGLVGGEEVILYPPANLEDGQKIEEQ